MHECGWVHRDISAGNVLLHDTTGKVADVEYAKHESDQSNHGVRIVGTILRQIFIAANSPLGHLPLYGC